VDPAEYGVPQSPAREYTVRLAARHAARDALSAADARIAHARLLTGAAAAVLALLAWRGLLSAWWLLVPLAAFIWLVRRHAQVLGARDAASRGIAFYERGLARLEDRWVGTGQPGDRFCADTHVYASDLDLFGRGSLFELLSLARTRTGEALLAAWLTSPADAVEIRARQEAVEELSPALDLRERLTLAGADVRAAVHTDRLIEWGESAMPPIAGLRAFTWCVTAGVLLAIPYGVLTSTWWPLGVIAAVQAVGARLFRDQMSAIVTGHAPDSAAHFVSDRLAHRAVDLEVVAGLLRHLEGERFGCSRLARLAGRLGAGGLPASRAIERLQRLSEFHSSEGSAVMLPMGLFVFGRIALALSVLALLQLARPHLALAVARWRGRHGRDVRVWLETIAEFEALSSLSAYRYEHSDDPFAQVISSDDNGRSPAVFEARQLGHPLLPRATVVRNDVHLAGGTELLVVSGSNMSGKSTLLRTVGVNAVLALAGAPVRAGFLRLSPLAIGGTLRIQDSLQEGRSRFYAEITRIRTLADLAAGPVPLLFLLDELFHGTNSHDRFVGSAGVLRSLLDRGAIGLITTHDLALTAVADELAPRAANVHFQDWFEGNELRFDYRLHPGPVTRSNALALMRAVGLDVPNPLAGGLK
jgi:MutS domain V/MutS domain III